MQRRVALLALLALCATTPGRRTLAQAPQPPRRICYLIATRGSDFPTLHDALRRGLSDLGSSRKSRRGTDGLVVLASPMHHRHIRQIAALALAHGLPAVCEFSEFTGVGGLLVYGPAWPDMYRHAAAYVAKILQGASPADLPVEQPTRIELVLNLATARSLGLSVPQAVPLLADRVIE